MKLIDTRMINRNMRCIEIASPDFARQWLQLINRNMRCIEIVFQILPNFGMLINRNMRCIEMRETPRTNTNKDRLIET